MYEYSGHTIDNKVKPIEIRNKKDHDTNIRHKGSFNCIFSQLLNAASTEPMHGVQLYSRDLSVYYFPGCYKYRHIVKYGLEWTGVDWTGFVKHGVDL